MRPRRALSDILTQVAQVGRSAPLLHARLALQRKSGKLPPIRNEAAVDVGNILFSYPYHRVGDFVLSISLLERIHRRWPNAAIDVAVGKSLGDFAEAIPYVRRVYRIKGSSKQRFTPSALEEMETALRVLHEQSAGTLYDIAISPRWDSTNAFLGAHLAFATGAPIRCGYSGSVDGGSKQYDTMFTHVALGGQREHETQRHSRLLERCGLEDSLDVPRDISKDRLSTLLQIVSNRRTDATAFPRPLPSPYVVLVPGAMQREKMWPAANFAAIGRSLFDAIGMRSVVLGGPNETALCESVRDDIGSQAISLAGKTTPLEAMDVIAYADLYVGNDSGPGHISGALGIPTMIVSPFPLDSTSDHALTPKRFRPMGPNVQIFQPLQATAPCTHTCEATEPHCILNVTPELLMTEILGMRAMA